VGRKVNGGVGIPDSIVVGVRLPVQIIKRIDALVRGGHAMSRADFLRVAIRDYLNDQHDLETDPVCASS